MLRSETLFGKRDATNNTSNTTTSQAQPFGSGLSSSSTLKTSAPAPTVPASLDNSAAKAAAAAAATSSTNEVGSKLIVGPNIKLKGVEITDCDTLVVEGLVEATMDSRLMQIAEQGEFKGSADIDIAEIRGVFDGNLTVREKLVIHSTGKVTGKIRYGKIVIEEGGQLSGEISFGAKPSLQAAA
jgi:cytoskeletal protein CcmA (bactofilin family)